MTINDVNPNQTDVWEALPGLGGGSGSPPPLEKRLNLNQSTSNFITWHLKKNWLLFEVKSVARWGLLSQKEPNIPQNSQILDFSSKRCKWVQNFFKSPFFVGYLQWYFKVRPSKMVIISMDQLMNWCIDQLTKSPFEITILLQEPTSIHQSRD